MSPAFIPPGRGAEHAKLLKRFLAALFDAVIVVVLATLIANLAAPDVFFAERELEIGTHPASVLLASNITPTPTAPGVSSAEESENVERILTSEYYLLLAIVLILYFTLFEGTSIFGNSTPGKRLLGLSVIRYDFSPAGPLQALARGIFRLPWILMLTTSQVAGIYLSVFGMVAILTDMVAIQVSHKRIGDFAARTFVIHEIAGVEGGPPMPPSSHG